MKPTLKLLLLLWLATLLAACAPAPTQPAPSITPSLNPDLPQSEADVPRVSPQEAKAAYEAGEAVIVDVRSLEAYNGGHAAGAISLPLADIETDPAAALLDKGKWIITYCT